jgi:NAD(P)-dependent dehydrogenase (short-subunit alcohol dehydrogenase family)
MDLGLTGARAIVTGGSRGIGLAVALGLAAEGARVALVARDAQRLESAAGRIRAAHPGCEVMAERADTTDAASVEAMVGRVVSAWGGVDMLVNCAAQPSFAAGPASLADLADADVAADFDAKVLGYLRCARAVAPAMARQGYGRIVNVSGLNARRTGSISGTIRNVAVAALTANLADELGPQGIGVTVVHPGRQDRADPPAGRRARRRNRLERAAGARRPRRRDEPRPHCDVRGGRGRHRLPQLAAGRRRDGRRRLGRRRQPRVRPLLAAGIATVSSVEAGRGVRSPRLSVLDFVPVRTGQSTADALAASLSLGRLADRLGYERFWFAEHHKHAGSRGDEPSGARRDACRSHRADADRERWGSAAQPLLARRRRAVRPARSRVPGSHRPGCRPRGRRRRRDQPRPGPGQRTDRGPAGAADGAGRIE